MADTLAPAKTPGRVRRWFSTTTWGATRWQRSLTAAIAAVIFWPQSSVDPVVGPDPSWQAGVALARIHHLAWGPDLVFTYGPLGFLQNTAYYSFGQSLLATIYQPIVIAALFLGIAAALRQRHTPMTSLIGAFLTTGIIAVLHIHSGQGWGVPGLEYPELAVLAAFAWGFVPLLEDDPKRSTVFATCVTLGAAAGPQLLVKFNTGITIAVIALAVSALLGWRAVGRHCATVGAFAASTLICWVLSGQRTGDLPAWLRSSTALTAGYSEAMAIPLNVGVVLILAGIAALLAMFVRGRPETSGRFIVLVCFGILITAKTAFARLDVWHVYPLLGFMVLALAVTPLAHLGKCRRRAVVAVVSAIVVLEFAVGTAGTFTFGYPDRTMAALQAPIQAVDRLATLALPGHVDQRIAHAKARQRGLYAIPDGFIKTIGSGTVHIDPAETSAVWAYDFAWRPAPVFQTYAAFTPTLDDLNSETLATGPQFVLSRLAPTSPAIDWVDGRLSVQESPRYSRALLCNYTVKGVQDRWALFARTGSHCGPLTPLSQLPVRDNAVITVPAPSGPDMAVLAAIDLQPTILDRLFQGTVAALTIPTIVVDGSNCRLIAANAAEPFLVSSPDSVQGTNLQIHAHTLGVGRAPALGGPVAARLRFYEMRVGS